MNLHPIRAVRLAALVCGGLAAASCRTMAPPGAPAMPRDYFQAEELNPQGGVAWSANRRLSWSDYRARPPADRSEAAMTATSVRWGYGCKGDALTPRVVAEFFPDQSWVNPARFVELGSSRRILQHEQTHFDLSEVYARRLRQTLNGLTRACARPENELTRLGARVVGEWDDAERRYDDETANGQDAAAQDRWERRVQQMLRAPGTPMGNQIAVPSSSVFK